METILCVLIAVCDSSTSTVAISIGPSDIKSESEIAAHWIDSENYALDIGEL